MFDVSDVVFSAFICLCTTLYGVVSCLLRLDSEITYNASKLYLLTHLLVQCSRYHTLFYIKSKFYNEHYIMQTILTVFFQLNVSPLCSQCYAVFKQCFLFPSGLFSHRNTFQFSIHVSMHKRKKSQRFCDTQHLLFVCLFVSRISEKAIDGFEPNYVQ